MNRPLLALACANFAVGTGALVIAGILKPLAGDLGISLAQAGQLISVYALAYAISSPLLTAGLATWQSKKVLLAGLALLFAGNLWGALSSGYSVLFLSRIAAACGGGLVTPAAGAIAASLVEPAQRVKALAIVFAGLTLATVLGVPLGTYVGLHSAWQGALVVALLFAAGATAAVILAVPGRLELAPKKWTPRGLLF